MPQKLWTAEETTLLIELWNDHNVSEIANKLKRTKHSINKKISHLRKKGFIVKQKATKKDTKKYVIGDSLIELIGTALYWCEGTKRMKWTAQFVNSDPIMIRIFLKFLRKLGLKEEKFRAKVKLLPIHNEKECIDFWSNLTKIPQDQFYKSIIRSDMPKRNKHKLQFGTLTVEYNSKKLIDAIKNKIQYLKPLF